ncbi:MAG TPA: Xaa-Pro aminopeptidase [Gemmatimonadaceae bacterium]|nr:Xaa-Pro aminopeptidase [Gemmatimonadaceae bacterium]
MRRPHGRRGVLAAPQLALLLAVVLLLPAARAAAQPVITNVFPAEEYVARRARVMAAIGDGVAILQGTTERPGEQPLRQSNQFHYLSGVVAPRALLVLDGRTKRSTLYLEPETERRVQVMFGPLLEPGDSAARVTGTDAVLPRVEFADAVAALAREGRMIYTPFRPEVLGSASAGDVVKLAKATREDPWDGRISRVESFIAKLREKSPRSEIRDLDPIIDTLRATKSPREIAVIREATRITGLGILEVMRDARPGMYEYELQAAAEYVFKKHGSYGPAYFALVATGRNTFYTHYHANTARLAAGDLVQFDYAPDYRNYTSDVTRIFPANGKFTARQRELYTIYLRLYQALLTSIRVHATPAEIVRDAVVKMDEVMAAYRFTDPKIREAAEHFVERYRKSEPRALGHTIGMEVHDVRLPTPTLEPGQIFTIEPQMTLPDEHIGLRLEDVILMTDSGYENLSAFVPVEVDDIERAMAGPGLSDALLRLPDRR